MNEHLPMCATLFPKGELPAHDVHEIARRISQYFPDSVVEWSRGDEWVQEGLQRLLRSRAPDVITESHGWLFGNVVYVSLAFREWPDQIVFAYVLDKRFQAEFELETGGPFDIHFLIHAAGEISQTLGYEFVLRTPFDNRFQVLSKPTAIRDPWEEARRSFPDEEPSALLMTPLPDWSIALHQAIVTWLTVRSTEHRFQSRLNVNSESPEAFAAAVVAQLNSISRVQKAWKVSVQENSWNMQVLLAQESWMTTISLNGVPI